MREFLEMGGYAAYVWPAYAASLGVLAVVTAAVIRRNAKVRRELAVLEARAARRKGARS